jgi:hypothetical protein
MLKIKNFAPAIGWGIFIFILCTIPGKDFPQIPDILGLLSMDKMVHMLFYAILTWLILRGWRLSKTTPITFQKIVIAGFIVACFSAGMGWFLEWYQETFCEDRLFEFLDGVANTIGAVISWISYSLLSYYKFEKD